MTARDPLKELEDALSFPTSPDFSARVRRQVAAAPRRSRYFATEGLAVAAAVILTAAVGFTAVHRSRNIEVAEAGRPIVADVPRAAITPRAETAVATSPVIVPRSVRMTSSGTAMPFETLVPDDQLRALDRLLAAMGQGRATVPPAVVVDELNDDGQRVLRALVIEPMKLELLAGKDPIK